MQRRRPRRIGTKPNFTWVSNVFLQQPAVVAGVAADVATSLLDASDWQQAPTVAFDRATVTRIVGSISFTPVTATLALNSVLYLGVVMEDANSASTFQPRTLADYDDHDIMWTQVYSLVDGTIANNSLIWRPWSREIDIKTKRRITSGQRINFCASLVAGGAISVNVDAVLRVLVKTE